MKFPIIVNATGDVLVFRNKEDLELALEVNDVKNGEYVAFDANATPLELSISTGKYRTNWCFRSDSSEKVIVIEGSDVEPDENRLKEVLSEYLSRVGVVLECGDRNDLSRLIRLVIDRVGYSA